MLPSNADPVSVLPFMCYHRPIYYLIIILPLKVDPLRSFFPSSLDADTDDNSPVDVKSPDNSMSTNDLCHRTWTDDTESAVAWPLSAETFLNKYFSSRLHIPDNIVSQLLGENTTNLMHATKYFVHKIYFVSYKIASFSI